MKRLTEIGLKYGTDKATYHSFTDVYDTYFSKYESPRILEIGVYNFASIQMYREYFKTSYIVGMDIDDKSQYVDGSWKYVRGDQSKIEDLERCVQDELPFDIIIDDGGHTMAQQQISFGFLFKHVQPGGIYILEDLHTSFRPYYREADCEFTSFEMLTKILDKNVNFSNYIDLGTRQLILDTVKSIEIFAKDPNNLQDSVTAVLQL